jgi:Short repeat of unknown function (DUF308)
MEVSDSIAGPLETLSSKRGWLLALGVILILLGIVALGDTVAVTFVSVVLVGWLLMSAGVFHVVNLVRHSEVRSLWGVLSTICDFVAGIYIVVHPALGADSYDRVGGVPLREWGYATDRRFSISDPEQDVDHRRQHFVDRPWGLAVGTLALQRIVVHRIRGLGRVDFPRLGMGDDSAGARESWA